MISLPLTSPAPLALNPDACQSSRGLSRSTLGSHGFLVVLREQCIFPGALHHALSRGWAPIIVELIVIRNCSSRVISKISENARAQFKDSPKSFTRARGSQFLCPVPINKESEQFSEKSGDMKSDSQNTTIVKIEGKLNWLP